MENEPELTLRDLIALLRRGLLLALGVAVGAAALTYFLSSRTTPEYDATATLLASRPNSNLQGNFGVNLVTAPVIDISAYQAATKSHLVLANALQRMGEANPSPRTVDDFADQITVRVETASQSSLLRLTVRDTDPDTAADAANAVAAAMLAWDEGRATNNLQVIVDTLETQIAALDAEIALSQLAEPAVPEVIEGLQSLRAERALQLNSARALRTSAVGLLEVLEPAIPPMSPSAPRPVRNAALAFVLGLFLVYGLVLLRDALDTRFRGGDDLTRVTNLPVIGEFPRLQNGVIHLPREATSYLRTNVLFATATDHPKILLVTSAGPSEGKSSVSLGLAESLARNDYRTLLIDADMRKPQLFKRLGLVPTPELKANTLAEHLKDPKRPVKPLQIDLGGAALDIIPTFAAAEAPTELLSRSFASLLRDVSEHYDAIVIDSPPVLPVADSMTMAPHTTGVVYAVSMPDADRRSVSAAIGLLERIGVRMLGIALTNIEPGRGGRSETGYGYGYGYGYGSKEMATPTTSTARQGERREPGHDRRAQASGEAATGDGQSAEKRVEA